MSANSGPIGAAAGAAAGGRADDVHMFDSSFQTVVESPKRGSLAGLFDRAAATSTAAAVASDDDKMRTVIASPQRGKLAGLFGQAAASGSPVTPPVEKECVDLRQQILDLNHANRSKTEDAQALQRTLRELQEKTKEIEESAPKTVIRRESSPSVANAFPAPLAQVATAKGAAAAAPVTPPTDDDERPKLRAAIRDFHVRNESLDVSISEFKVLINAAQSKLAKLQATAAKA